MKHTHILLLILTFALLSTLSYAQEYTTDSNTVALWHFNEGSGSLAKDETGRFNGTISGAVWVDGKYREALSFGGTNNAVTISSSSSEEISNQITLEAWVNPAKSSGRIVGRYGITSDRYHSLSYLLTLDNGKLALYINSPSASSAVWSTLTVPLNAWTHVAATYDGSTVKFYINGNLDSTSSLNSGNIRANAAPIIIGNDGYSDVAFGGIIDEVRISNIVRAEFNVQAGNQTNQTDTILPTVSVNHTPSSPTTDDNVTITATAYDNVGISSINIYVDNSNVKSCNSSPCVYSATYSASSYDYYALATDTSGNTGRDPSSRAKSFTVAFSGNETCNCTSWSNAGCGISPCSYSQIKQVRNCTGAGCANTSEYQCVSDSSCIPTSNNCTDTDDSLGGSQGYMGYGVKGTVTIDGTSYTDYCESPNAP